MLEGWKQPRKPCFSWRNQFPRKLWDVRGLSNQRGHHSHASDWLGNFLKYVPEKTSESGQQKSDFGLFFLLVFLGLRNRGYNKKFLTTLFRKNEFGSRNKLLLISEDVIDHLEIDSNRSDTVLINDAEHMFQDIFSEVILPRENTQQQICANSINLLSLSVAIPKVCLYFHHYLCLEKTNEKTKKCLFFLFFILFFRKKILLSK